MSDDHLHYFRVDTRKGNTVTFFFNEESNLVVCDLVHSSGKGGFEFLRKYLDESILDFAEDLPEIEESWCTSCGSEGPLHARGCDA